MTGILHVVGARPNFPKLAPVHEALRRRGVAQAVVHTGQHYDDLLSDSFFKLLRIPEPDVNLSVGSGSHAQQTARIMERIEPVLIERRPDWLVVYGDVNSTAAATLVASKLGIRVAHVEAGLRSFDREMPEEINRLVTDRLSDLLLTPSRDADENLLREGVEPKRIVFVGNVMIDSLCRALPHADAAEARRRYGIESGAIVVTLHRPSNVDVPDRLARVCDAIAQLSLEHPVFFPMHPRTRRQLSSAGLSCGGALLHDPIPYLDMLALVRESRAVITDSGGLQEETSVLGVPCLTLRYNTERPVTVTSGTNQLVPEPEDLVAALGKSRRPATLPVIEGWDGAAGARIADALCARSPAPSSPAAPRHRVPAQSAR